MVKELRYVIGGGTSRGTDLLGPVHGSWDIDDGQGMLVSCAQHFYKNHQGWELSWPQTIEVYDGRGEQVLVRGPVQLDYKLYFHTGRKRSIDSDRLEVVL